jgi:hypothetical protein
MKNVFTTLIFVIAIVQINWGQQSIETKLFELPDVIFSPLDAPDGFEKAFEIFIKQPVNHDDQDGAFFYQKLYLSHRGWNKPTVLITEGYERSFNRIYEITDYIGANQLTVEHRFCGESVPNPKDWQHLNVRQSSGDLHRVKTLFSDLYSGKWVSSGISKGGQTTLFYKYFYPEDVDVSIPYVAPINLTYEEPRIYEFLDKVGDKSCRKDIYRIQREMLERKEEILPLLRWYAKGKELNFNRIDLETAYEYAVLEYSFSFWQMGHDCNSIPESDISTDELIDHFIDIVGIDFYADKEMEQFAPHYYQASSQMGYYGFETEQFDDLLDKLEGHPHASFPPENVDITFDNTDIVKAANWLKEEGNNIIYIYGAIDTWSATALKPSKKTNSIFYWMEGKDHTNARIRTMDEEEKKLLNHTLKSWLGVVKED